MQFRVSAAHAFDCGPRAGLKRRVAWHKVRDERTAEKIGWCVRHELGPARGDAVTALWLAEPRRQGAL